MKRFAIFLGSLLVMPAFAEVVPAWYDDETIIEYDDALYEDADVEEDAKPEQAGFKPSRQVNSGRVTTANRSAAARTMTAGASGTTTRASNSNSKRVVAARTTTTPRTRAVSERGAISRAAARPAGTRGFTARTATPVRAEKHTNNVVARAATTNYTSIQGQGPVLYNPTNTNTVTYDSTGTDRLAIRQQSSAARSPVIRAASNTLSSGDSNISTADMDELVELTDYCKAQYAACMDNYCNVLDSNQGRCVCSANLKNYAKVEAALKSATEELQEVAQKFQYIGLSSREVEQLFSETEAELKMKTKSDTTQLKTSLDKIKDMIVNVQSGNASSSTGLSFDLSGLLDFSIDSMGFDLSSFIGMSDTSNVSNQRGEELFKTATARCKANVLNACTAQGVNASLVTNAYDLGIDKACIEYERNLNDSNDQMVATVRNAKTVLQRARLLVAKTKNEYDMRQCVNQLDSCMQDDFVCGSDYDGCLDPTGKYIVDGKIVVGSTPGSATGNAGEVYKTWDYQSGSGSSGSSLNAWTGGTLADYIDKTVVSGASHSTSVVMSKYLQNKIGYIDATSDEKVNGMCVAVLKKCQDYSYKQGKYNETNDVIKQYLNRVLVQIKARQDEILSDYAETCTTDVATCLNQNGYPSAKPGDTSSGWSSSKETVAVNACKSVITTCMSVNNATGSDTCWARAVQYSDYTSDDCE
jgi:hypothetical protein